MNQEDIRISEIQANTRVSQGQRNRKVAKSSLAAIHDWQS